MSFIKTASVILSAISTTVVMSALGANKANALSEVSLPSTIMIKSAHSNLVVDKYGDNPSFADKAHLYSQANPATFTLRPIRSANGSYETQLASRTNLCFTAAGGLNPNMGNGTQAVFSGDCANSLNLRFYDDGTVRIGRNTGMCLTNQGNRYNTLLNKLHFWACDGSPETKWNFVAVGNVTNYNFTTPYIAPAQNNRPKPANTIVNTQPVKAVLQTSKEEMWQTFFGFAVDIIKIGYKKTFAGIAKDWLYECAISDHCLIGQNIIRGTDIFIPEDKIYLATGNCFNPYDKSLAYSSTKQIATYLSKSTGVPIVYSYYLGSRKSFVFGIAKK
jgi:hypothetical protein